MKIDLEKYTNTEFEHFVLKGIHFGYPLCCIQKFVESIIDGSLPPSYNIKGNISGFIPCPNHNNITKENGELSKLIDYSKHGRAKDLPKFKEIWE